MASGMGATDVGAIKARLTLDTGNFKTGMESAKKQMKETDDSAAKTTKSISAIGSALAALGSTAALGGLVRTIKTLTEEANVAAMSVKGLAEVSKALNVNIAESTGLAQELANKGFMTLAEASSAVKTLLSSGLGLEETRKLIYATADAAAYNREAHLSWGEAIVQVTRGIKSGNSELTDAAGITTNLSVMQDRYAKSIGTTADKLTDAQKVQAAYSEIMKESALYAGNADTALQGFAGTQAVFNQTITVARQELGEAYLPAIQALMEALTPIIVNVTTWVSANKEMTVGLTAAAGAFLAVAAAVGTLSAALGVLQISLGPVGWAIAGITAVAGAVTAYTVASDAASESTLKWAKNQDVLNAKLMQDATKRSAEDVKGLQGDIDALNTIMEKRNKLMDEYNALERKAQSGGGSAANTNRMFEVADGIKEIDASLRKLDFANADEAAAALQRMNKAYADSIPARVQVEKSNITQLAQNVQQANNVEKLRKKYEELSKIEKLNDTQKAELASTVKQLAQQYPDVIAQMDAEGRYIITNTDLLNAQVSAEQYAVRTKAELRKQDLQDLQKTTKLKIEAAKAEVEALKATIEATTARSGMDATAQFDESKVNPLLTGAAREYAVSAGKALNTEANRQVKAGTDKINALQTSLIDMSRMIDSLSAGKWDDFLKNPLDALNTPTTAKTKAAKSGKSAAEIAAELRRDMFAQDLATARYNAQMYDQSADEQIAAIESIREKHAQYLAENIDDERSLALQIKALNATKTDDSAKSAKAAYEYSAEWIEMEERRLREKGASESEVAAAQLDAWTRVKARYDSDSDEYKAADKAMYTARMTLIKEAEATQKKADESREQSAKEAKNTVLDAIDEQKKAELKALDERKQAVKDYYDAQLKALDQSERSRDRAKIQAEAEKYRLATSEAGQKHYAELIEELRKMDVEDTKTSLQDARDAEMDTLAKRKDDIESWYSDIKASIENFGGDISQIYAATEDSRFQAFVSTNTKIKAEMERFKSEMSALNSVSSASTPESSYEASIMRQMKANANAWWTADDAGKRRLEAESQALGASIGATNYGGTWYRGGTPLFHSGGIAGGMSFASGSGLASDELRAILRQGEVTLTPAQIQSVVSGIGGKGGGGTTVHIEKFIEMNDATFEDGTDWNATLRAGSGEAAEIMRRQISGGGT